MRNALGGAGRRAAAWWSRHWDRHVAATVEKDYLPGLYATRRRRRALVAIGVFGLACVWVDALVLFTLAPGGFAVVANTVLLVAAIVCTVTTSGLLGQATRGSTDLAERHLDERQVAERLRAYTIAHRWTLAALTLLFVPWLLLSRGRGFEARLPEIAVIVLLMALWFTHMYAPRFVAGWRLPDAPPDEDADDGAQEPER
ncbi:hypothetical protein [Allonocardiopsis opalescens]|uniref:Uncharacterized protein n=1 Tax=Allonocardiopsis opalescens TaxID=1144618 RepID=A0A2T0Q6D9_9ACTN|nr:hypothetical protein [Allonocardiopsis opalescens]PRX99409.1 hypothetical protein CLV72_1035 [Allonocardiopsis opalescens]